MPSSFRNLAAALLAVWAAGCAPDPAPALVSIRVAPIARSTLSTAEAFQLEATVEGSTDTRVEWLGVGVSPRGLFESATPGTFTVTAHCLADRGRAATATLRVVARPAVTAFTVEPPTLTAGEGAVLSWAVEGASTVLVDGVQQPGASLQVQPTSTRTYGLTVTNEAGLAVSAAVTVTVVAPPEIDAFTADHPAVTAGEPTALRWTTQGATDVRLDGEPVTGSALLLTPTQTKGYLLEARNALGFSVSRTVGIEVAPLPRILAFYPDAASLTAGESTALRWIVADAAQLSLDGSPVTGTSALIVPSATGEHQLEARNALGFAVTTRTHVTVVPAPVIQAFSSDAATLTGGQSTTLRWTTSAASEVRLDGALVTSTALAITPLATTDYLLEAKNPAGFAVTSTVRVTVVPAPVIVTFTSDRPGITAGESTTLRWTTTGAADLRLDGTVVTGTSQPIAPATTTSFTLTATNAAGFAVTRTVNVAVVPAPVIVAFTADASTVTAGTGTTLRWTTTGTTEVRLNGTPVTGLSAAISPAATGAHTLEVKNAIGFTATQTLTVTVVPAAVIASFTAARVAVTQGESTQLSWSVSNAATLFVNGAAVTGSTLTVSPAATTAYTLEARNSIGSAVTAALTLTVVPPVALNFAASPASVVVGTPSTLSWTSAGAAMLTLDGSTVGGNSLAVSPLRTTSYVLRATNSLGFETSQTLTLTVAPYPGVVWSAAGQVWLRWNDSPALTGTQTWDIYRSTSPITTLSSATRVGRLLPEDVHAARLKLADTTATWVLPTAAGGTTTLGATEAHFTWTPRTAETSFFAVVPAAAAPRWSASGRSMRPSLPSPPTCS